jgi:uncharacterized protein
MKIIALTDLHGKQSVIPRLSNQFQTAELVLLCGDITHFGRSAEMEEIIRQLYAFHSNVYGVTGNCDYPEAENVITEKGINLNNVFREFRDLILFGISGSLPCPGKTPHEFTEEEYRIMLHHQKIPANKPFIMVSHQPPYHTLNDQVSPGYHVGSKSIRMFIEKHQPVVCFTGHIHEGIAIDKIGRTTVVNPGPASKGYYAIAEIEGEKLNSVQLCNLYSDHAKSV